MGCSSDVSSQIQDKAFGYNPSFLYPTAGGIKALPEAFLPFVDNLRLGEELVEIHTGRRRALFRNGAACREESYESLVSTIPVTELVTRCVDLPPSLKEAAASLRWVSVYSVNLGVARAGITDKHWIYFPEPTYPFYRAGFPMNFAPELGRSGCSSLYVEISHRPAVRMPEAELLRQVRRGLERAGILRATDSFVVQDVKDIHYAYVLFDRHRARVLPEILLELERRGIHSIGRYGRWEHTSMEDAISQGKQTAARLMERWSRAA